VGREDDRRTVDLVSGSVRRAEILEQQGRSIARDPYVRLRHRHVVDPDHEVLPVRGRFAPDQVLLSESPHRSVCVDE
jgi:hypothetical protein